MTSNQKMGCVMNVYLVEYYKNSDDSELVGVFDQEFLALKAKEEFQEKYDFVSPRHIFISTIELNKVQECFT
ncbi:hypothetical protein ACXDJA_002628 [Klebsiella variicola]